MKEEVIILPPKRTTVVVDDDRVQQLESATIQTDFEADKLSPEVGETVQFTDLSTLSPSKWGWFFGDGNSSEQENPTHTYQSTGKKTVRLHAGGTGSSPSDAGNVAEKVDYIDVQKQAFITEAFIATTGGILNSSGSAASSGDSIETVEGQEEPTLNRDLSQTTGSQQPQGVEVNGVLALQGDGNDDFMRFLNVTRQDWEDLIAQGTFAVSFMTNPDEASVQFGYNEGSGVSVLAIGNAGGPQFARISDDNGNQKRFDGTTDVRGSVVIVTAVFYAATEFDLIINGTDEASLNMDEDPDFSNVDMTENPEGAVYLGWSVPGGVTGQIGYPCSKEFFVHDANSVSQGHHMDAHSFLRNLYNV